MAVSLLFDRDRLPGWLQNILDHMDATMNGYLDAEHGPGGVHADVTATSIDVAGATALIAATAPPAGGSRTARVTLGSTAHFGVYYGSGAPTVAAAKGSLYMRTDGSSTSTRAYVNTDGSTTWTSMTTAA